MLLGTYHFANPGRDVIKQDIDDVLQPKRQAELEDLATRLASWKPDRIAVEWPISQTDTVRARYARYLEKTLPPNRNEVVWMRTTTLREHLLRLNGDDALHDGNSLGMFGG